MRIRTLATLCAAGLLAFVLTACGSSEPSATPSGSTSGSPSGAPSAPAPAPTPKTFGIGSTQTSGSFSATLLGYRESEGKESWNKPDEGNVFVLVQFELENVSSSDATVSSILCFEAYVDGYKIDEDFGAAMEADGTLDGTLAAGRKMKGEIGFQVPANWKTLEVVFNDNPFSSKEAVTFTITK